MDDIKFIAENLGKIGMFAEKIANVLEMDSYIVELWLNDAGIDPKKYKDMLHQKQMDRIAAAI